MTTKKKYVSSREERAQATREKLLEAAIELVNQYGMKYLTVRNICDETGLEFITGLYAANTNQAFNFLERDPKNEMVLDRVREYLIEGKASGEIRSDVDINMALLRIGVIITGMIYYWCIFGGRIDLASQTDLMLQNYLITLAANKNASFELEPISPLEGSLI